MDINCYIEKEDRTDSVVCMICDNIVNIKDAQKCISKDGDIDYICLCCANTL